MNINQSASETGSSDGGRVVGEGRKIGTGDGRYFKNPICKPTL